MKFAGVALLCWQQQNFARDFYSQIRQLVGFVGGVPLPLSGSELLGTLGVDGHGPVHAASKTLLQQQLCDVAVLQKTRNLSERNSRQASEVAGGRGGGS